VRKSCERAGGGLRTMDIAVVDKEGIVLSFRKQGTVAGVCICFAINLMGLEDRVCFCDSQAI
jgi:hypothetical protein